MAAISKAWVTISDGAVDPNSPGTTTLFTGFRDNLIHLREWLGADFTAGAVKNHRHDGVDSALVPVGPNQLRNGSFEDGEDGWTFTDFVGGSHAISTTNHRHGAKSAQITSTVLANGGGDAVNNEYLPVSEADVQALKFWIWASVANVSSKLEVVWYDNAKAQISVSVIQSYTNTPTTPTYHTTSVTAPANARFYRAKITGGIPGSGTATGTITFDGIEASGLRITQAMILAGAVGQAQLKTATASGSVNIGGAANASYTLTGGTYSIWTASGTATSGIAFGNGNVAAGVIGVRNMDPGGQDFFVDENYIQASGPWNLGNGDIPLFVMALIASDGKLRGVSVGRDAVWGYNGPTCIIPERWENGKPYRHYPELEGMALYDALKSSAVCARYMKGDSPIVLVEREITQEVKNLDMPLVPHPWQGNVLTGLTPVMLDPFDPLVARLLEIQTLEGAAAVRDLILAGSITIGNTALALNAPPGVMPVTCSWKLTV